MGEPAGPLPPTARLNSLASWRARLLRGMLPAGALVPPLAVLIALALRSAPFPWGRGSVLLASTILFPLFRVAPGLSTALRAWLSIAICFLVGVSSLTTFGFSSGSGIVLAVSSLLAVVMLGRRAGFVMVGLSTAAFLIVGTLASRGLLAVSAAELAPTRLANWIRTAVSFACLSTLLTLAIDSVIRHVEHTSEAASGALHDLRAAYERLALLHERLDAAKEDERRHVANELHDDLGQILTVIKLRLTMSGQAPPSTETMALIDQAIDRVRKISRDLRPAALDQVGLMPALRDHAIAQSALSGVTIDLQTDDEAGERLPPALEIACFRIVQESLTNALRHAAATRIQVRATRRDDKLVLVVVDDGKGFDTAAVEAAGGRHLGILGMQERVRARGGTLRITSRPGGGTRVEVEVPIDG
jgi:signal transduction histidine kinase